MEDETRNTAELLDVPYLRPGVYVWRGQALQGSTWVPVDPPVGGDSVALGTFGMLSLADLHGTPDADDVRYVEIPGTAWGDYVGSTWYRSNARSIRRDWSDHVVQVTGCFGFEVMLLPLSVDIPVELFDAITGLGDYPVYDEGDLSELETELESEDWQSWGRSDWAREIRKLAQGVDADDDVSELDDPKYVDALFCDIYHEGDVGRWCSETAVSGYWEDFDRAAGLAWAEIQRRRMASLQEWACELSAPIPGQLALAI